MALVRDSTIRPAHRLGLFWGTVHGRCYSGYEPFFGVLDGREDLADRVGAALEDLPEAPRYRELLGFDEPTPPKEWWKRAFLGFLWVYPSEEACERAGLLLSPEERDSS
jgi:hypothetical protein